MISIILYILLGIGVGYFVYLIYRKWPELKKQEIDVNNLPTHKAKLFLRSIFGAIKHKIKIQPELKHKIELKPKFFSNFKILKVFRIERPFREAKNWKFTLYKFPSLSIKKKLTSLGYSARKHTKFFKGKVRRIKFPKVQIHFPERIKKNTFKKQQEPAPFMTEDLTDEQKKEDKEQPLVQKLEKSKFFRFFKVIKNKVRRLKINLTFLQPRKLSLKTKALRGLFQKAQAGQKNKIKKLKVQNIIKSLKKIKTKVKMRFISPEDEKMKKQLEKSTEFSVKPESYLGELLEKTKALEEEKTQEGQSSFPKEEKKESFVAKPIAKEAPKETTFQKPSQAEELTIEPKPQRKKNLKPSPIQVSEETIKKIEEKLIKEIIEDSKNIEAYKRLGRLYYNQFKYAYAQECFKAAIKLGSGDKKIKRLLKKCRDKASRA